MPSFSNKKPSTSLGWKLQIKSTLVHLFAKHEEKEQESQEHSSSLTNHLISQSKSDENNAIMESILTQSLLPYDVEHDKGERDLHFSNDNCDSSLTAMIVTN
jgi:DNA replication protein DnaD